MQTILVLDFGGQYKELIARRVREMNVLSIIKPSDISLDEIKKINPIGIILTDGPASIFDEGAEVCDKDIFELGIPVLAVSYGMRFMANALGGKVENCKVVDDGRMNLEVDTSSKLFTGLVSEQIAYLSHGEYVSSLPSGFKEIAKNDICSSLAIEDEDKKLYGVDFHPEVEITPNGKKMIRNFVYSVCGATGEYTMDGYIEEQIKAIREQVGNETVILGISGGVDSSVVAALLSKAIGNQLICIFVDHGLMRKNEGDEVEDAFKKFDLRFVRVNAEDRFLSLLKGITDPETKRKIIGGEFIKVFEDEAKKFGKVKFLAQGTIYPDIIESGSKNKVIKSHHNVGGLPKNMDFKELVEPLKGLFKDEVRVIGRKLGLPDNLVNRQPFPGPGLGVRVIGEITKEKLDILRDADAIFRYEMKKAAVKANQYFAVLTNMRSVGVKNNQRTYDYILALRAVETTDFMTCNYCKVPHEVLDKVATRISNEVEGVGRIVFDISGKPPATIEWE